MTLYIGITGLPASGKELVKDGLLQSLAAHNISAYHWSMSDDVRHEAKQTVGNYTRETLIATSRRLKDQFGPAVMAIRALNYLEGRFKTEPLPDVIVMEAVKNSHEVEFFREQLGESFLLLGIEAPIETLIDRIIARKRYDEDQSVLANRNAAHEMIELEKGTPGSHYGFDVGYCLSLADYTIDSTGDLATFRQRVGRFAKSIIIPRLTRHSPG
jgi:dephospho-CoA kinase